MDILRETMITVLTTVLTALVTLAGSYLVLYLAKLKAKAQAETLKINDESARNLSNSAIERLNEIVYTTIVKMENTMKQEIIKASEDGTISRNELKNIATVVKTDVLGQASEQVLDAVELQIKDVGSYVEGLIEKQLLEVKKNTETK